MHASNETALKTSFDDTVRTSKSPAAASRRTKRHSFDVRLSLPWFGTRYYVRLLSGLERRNVRRLHIEHQSDMAKISLVYGVILFVFFALAMFGAAVFLYIVKSMLGINLFEAHSPFHRIFF